MVFSLISRSMTFPAISMAMPPISPLTSLTAFFFSWAISFLPCFQGSRLFGSLFYDFLALQRCCLSGAFENLVGLFLGLLHILLIFLFDGVGFFFAASASVISASAAARRFSSISLIGLKRNRLIRYIWMKRLQICAIKVQGTIPTSS